MTENIQKNPKFDQEKIDVLKYFLQELLEDPSSTYSNSILKIVKLCVSVIKGDKALSDIPEKQYIYVEFLLNYKDFFARFLDIPTLTAENIQPYYKELFDIFSNWQSQSDMILEWKDKYTRLYAEFDNYKKRAIKEKQDLSIDIRFKSNREIINILDDLNLAKASLPKESSDGLNLIFNKLDNYLENNSIKKININKGDRFDSEISECIATIPSADLKDGDIIDVLKSPYTIDDRIVRFGQVIVCKN